MAVVVIVGFAVVVIGERSNSPYFLNINRSMVAAVEYCFVL